MSEIKSMISALEKTKDEEQLFEKESEIAEKTQSAYMNGQIDDKQLAEISESVSDVEDKMRNQFDNKTLRSSKTR